MNLAESAEFNAGVNLSRGDRGVPEHFLNNTKIGAPRQQVRREAVTEGVRTDLRGETRLRGVRFDDRPESNPRQRAAPSGHEDRLGGGPPCRKNRTIALKIRNQCLAGARAERNDTFLVPLANAACHSSLKIEIHRPEAAHLGRPATRCVEGFKSSAITASDRRLATRRVQQALDGGGPENRG